MKRGKQKRLTKGKEKGKHGGKRDGAGRSRKYNEPTVPMRVPVSLVSHVVGLIKKP